VNLAIISRQPLLQWTKRVLVMLEKSEGIVDVSWFDEQAALRAIEYKATKVLLEEGAKRVKKAYGIQ